MGRKFMQTKRAQTVVNGFVLRDGTPAPASFVLERKAGLESAQAIVRRDEPSFMAANVNITAKIYRMPVERFIELAECIDVDPDTIDENDNDE